MHNPCSHSFDAQKSRENEASSERQAGKPQGKRWSAAAEWQEQHQRKRSQQEQDEEQKQVQRSPVNTAQPSAP